VAANPALRDGGCWWRWLHDPNAFSTSGAMFRPVVVLSLGLQFLVSDAALWLKAGNLLLHALVTALAFGWLCRLGLAGRGALAVSALFAVHPLVSEAINLVSARSELLLYLGLLVALRSHLAQLRGGRPWPALAGIALGTVIACGSKETGVVLPGLLLAQAFVLRRGTGWSGLPRALGIALPSVLLVAGYLLLRQELLGTATVSLAGRTGGDPLSGHGRSLLCQLATMGCLLPRALFQMVFPVGLSLDPAVRFEHSLAAPVVLVGWGSTLLLLVLGLLPGPGARVRQLGVLLAVATALPWVVVPLNVPLAEHRLYGPLLGMLMVAAPWLPRPGRRPFALGGLVVLGLALGNLRSLDYRDEVRLWQAELARGDSWRAWWGLGAARLRSGDCAGAVEPLAQARARNRDHVSVVRNLAEALVSLPDAQAMPERALAAAADYLAARPQDPWAHTVAAQACLQQGRVRGDRAAFLRAEQFALACLAIPDVPPKGYVFRLAAAARLGLDEPAAALAHLDESLRLGLDHHTVRLARADVLRRLGRAEEAWQELRRAQREAPLEPAVLAALRAARPPR
jgi:tetratricopeptide (TPR) repeat protein